MFEKVLPFYDRGTNKSPTVKFSNTAKEHLGLRIDDAF